MVKIPTNGNTPGASGNSSTEVPSDSTSMPLDEAIHQVKLPANHTLVHKTNMLRGTIITPEGLRPSTWDILDYTGELPFAPMNKSVHEVSSVKNSDASMLLRNGWTAAVINACAPWIFLSCDMVLRDNTTNVYSCAYAHHVRGIVDFNVDELRPRVKSEFQDAVVTALSAKTREDVRRGLRAIFNRSGHIFQTCVWLGSAFRCSGFIDDKYEMYQAKLSSLLFRRVREMKGPATNDVVDKVDHNTVVLVNFQAYGGQLSLLSDPSPWLKSTESFEGWVITKVQKVVPIIELLEPQLCQQVIAAFAPLIGRWVEGHKADGIPNMTAYPGWYWLCQTKSKSKDDSPVKCLIVQDRTGNCLMPAPSPVIVAQDRGVVVSKSEVDSGLPFNVLSSFLWDASGTPDFGQLRAVRRDLLIHGTVSTPVDMVDKTGVVVVDLPGTTFAWGDPIHVVETKHISLIGQHLNRTSSSSGPPIPQPLLLSKYAIDL